MLWLHSYFYCYLCRPLLFLLPPEYAHQLTLGWLKLCYSSSRVHRIRQQWSQKNLSFLGLNFPSRIGLAAGLDKNGDYIDALFGLGFGFIELGTVTPRPQPGNPKPRLFRLTQANALINQLGFNNHGVAHLVQQLKARHVSGILGVNIGKNASTPLSEATSDYQYCLEAVYPYADYVTVNISSPNTPGLRSLHADHYLKDLLATLHATRQRLSDHYQKSVPIVLKVSPDLSQNALKNVIKTALLYQIDGFVAVNTTCQRTRVAGYRDAEQSGGLSGAPLFPLTLRSVQQLREEAPDSCIIATGGIMNLDDAKRLLAVGASLVQVYTGLIYKGPHLIHQLRLGL